MNGTFTICGVILPHGDPLEGGRHLCTIQCRFYSDTCISILSNYMYVYKYSSAWQRVLFVYTIIFTIYIFIFNLSTSGRADQEQIGVALGFVAHLVFLLARFLMVPLQYILRPNGSRSIVSDNFHEDQGLDVKELVRKEHWMSTLLLVNFLCVFMIGWQFHFRTTIIIIYSYR